MFNRRTFAKGTLGSSVALASALAAGRRAKGGTQLTDATTLPYILVVYASGGWDPTMVFTDKVGSGDVAQETGWRAAKGAGDIPYVDNASRPAVKAFFDRYGGSAAIVNGITTGSMEMRGGIKNVLGFTPKGRARPTDWLSFFTQSLNPVLDVPHAVLDAPFFPGDYASVAVKLTKQVVADHGAAVTGDALGDAGEAALRAFRASQYGSFQKDVSPLSLDGEKLRALFYGHARESHVRTRVSDALTALGAQGADSDFLRNGKLAVEMFASGATQCATVQAGATGLWETTTDHFARQSANYEALFSDLNDIIAHASTKGVHDNLLVVVVSERGRAPTLNAQAGKAPWAYTSALLWGLGIKGGTVVDTFTSHLLGAPINPLFGAATQAGSDVTLSMAHVFAAIYLLFGAPYQLVLPDVKPLTPILQVS